MASEVGLKRAAGSRFGEARALGWASAVRGIPPWLITFVDMMTLILCVFVCMLSMSDFTEASRVESAVRSIRGALGGVDEPGAAASSGAGSGRLVDRLAAMPFPAELTWRERMVEAVSGSAMIETALVDDGLRLTIGGPAAFESGAFELSDGARGCLASAADMLRRCGRRLIVRGHCDASEAPRTDVLRSARELSYLRASAVADVLQRTGIAPNAIVVVAVGAGEPLEKPVFTDRARARHRRVEILVTEDDVEGEADNFSAMSLTESSHGRPEKTP